MIQQSLFGEKKKSEVYLTTCCTRDPVGLCAFCIPKSYPGQPNNAICNYKPVYQKVRGKQVRVDVSIPDELYECPCFKDHGSMPMVGSNKDKELTVTEGWEIADRGWGWAMRSSYDQAIL